MKKNTKRKAERQAALVFADELQRRRKELGLSYGKLGCLFGWGNAQTLTYLYCTGQRIPGLPMAIAMANALGLDLGDIQRKVKR